MALSRGESVAVVLDILRHVDVKRCPVILIRIQEILPGPGVSEWRELIDVAHTVNDALVFSAHGRQAHFGGHSFRLPAGFRCYHVSMAVQFLDAHSGLYWCGRVAFEGSCGRLVQSQWVIPVKHSAVSSQGVLLTGFTVRVEHRTGQRCRLWRQSYCQELCTQGSCGVLGYPEPILNSHALHDLWEIMCGS